MLSQPRTADDDENTAASRSTSQSGNRFMLSSAASRPDRLVTVLVDPTLVVLGNAEQHAHHAQRHDGAEILDEVEPVAAGQRAQARCVKSRIIGSRALIWRG
jgi:hypothetical protein